MKISGKTFVVTGGGSGIGLELVLQLLELKAHVAAVDIRGESLMRLEALASENSKNLSLHTCDVSDRKAVDLLPDEVLREHKSVDGLINNAGIIQPFLKIKDLDYAKMQEVMNVNFWGQVYMIKSFLPYLLDRPEAHIVNVSSMGGFFPFPGQSMYGASKAAVKLLSEGLYAELIDTNVGVSVVFPGATATKISENSGIESTVSDADSSNFPTTAPEEAAQAIIAAIQDKRFQVFIGRDAKMMNWLYKISPKRATQFMQRQMKDLIPE